MAFRTIGVRGEGPVEWLTLGRGEALSTLTLEMVDELSAYFAALPARLNVRAVVVMGEGKHFCAGLDLNEPSDAPDAGPAFGLPYMQRFGDIVLQMRRAPQVILAGVRGAAAGGGFCIALGCDLRLASASAVFATAFLRLGLSGMELGMSYLLPRLVGGAVAAEVMLTGRRVDAAEALRIGLVSRVVEEEALIEAVGSVVADMLASAPFALRLTKQMLVSGLAAPSLDIAIELESRNQALCFATGDVSEGRRAFAAREAPSFAEHRTR